MSSSVIQQEDFISQGGDPASSRILASRNMTTVMSCGFFACAVARVLTNQLEGREVVTKNEYNKIVADMRRSVLKALPDVVEFFHALRLAYVSSHETEFTKEEERTYFMTAALGVFELSAWLADLSGKCEAMGDSVPAFVRHCYRPGMEAGGTLHETEQFECERVCIAQEDPFIKQGLSCFLEHKETLTPCTSATAALTQVFLVDVGGHFVCTWTPIVIPDEPEVGLGRRHVTTFNSLTGYRCSTDADTSSLRALVQAKAT